MDMVATQQESVSGKLVSMILLNLVSHPMGGEVGSVQVRNVGYHPLYCFDGFGITHSGYAQKLFESDDEGHQAWECLMRLSAHIQEEHPQQCALLKDPQVAALYEAPLLALQGTDWDGQMSISTKALYEAKMDADGYFECPCVDMNQPKSSAKTFSMCLLDHLGRPWTPQRLQGWCPPQRRVS